MKWLRFVLLLFPTVVQAELRYNDCVEITGGFYYSEDEKYVGFVRDRRKEKNEIFYKVGSILFGVWIEEKNLKKIDKKVCKSAEKGDENDRGK